MTSCYLFKSTKHQLSTFPNLSIFPVFELYSWWISYNHYNLYFIDVYFRHSIIYYTQPVTYFVNLRIGKKPQPKLYHFKRFTLTFWYCQTVVQKQMTLCFDQFCTVSFQEIFTIYIRQETLFLIITKHTNITSALTFLKAFRKIEKTQT